ncbi:MAG: HU family DNA-binding protein [Prevotella sp.]|nr:HU family DNA-binding protein [Prevotella sp.]
MPIFYYLYQNNREHFLNKGKWYARVIQNSTRSLHDIAGLIQSKTHVKKSDVLAVLTALPTVMDELLSQGHRLRIDGLGTFKVSISSRPAARREDFSTDRHIVGTRIVFQPATRREGRHGKPERIVAANLEYEEVCLTEKNT